MTDNSGQPDVIRVLLVEDNPADVSILERLLKSSNRRKFVVTSCGSLGDCLKRIELEVPDIVLLDLNLPDSMGLITLEKLIAKSSSLPVLVISGLDDEDTSFQAISRGAQGYLVKSRFDAGLLVRSLLSAIELKRANEAIERERDLARNYLDIVEEMIVVIDTSHAITLVNRKTCEILGYEEKELVGRNWIDLFVSEKDRERIKTTFADLIAGRNESWKYVENLVQAKNGGERIIAWHNTVLRDDTGAIVSTLSSGSDITDKKKTEAALAISEKRARQVLENVQLIVVGLDRECRITFCNDCLLKSTGWRREEVMGKDWCDFFIPAGERATIRKVHVENLSGGTRYLHFENTIITRQGETRHVSWDNTVECNDEGKVVSIISLGEDVTKRKQSEEKDRKQLEELRRWHEVVTGREERIVELKREVNELARRVGEKARYGSGE